MTIGWSWGDKRGIRQCGKTMNADQTISNDRVTTAGLQRWREVQNREGEFFGSDYNPCVHLRGRPATAPRHDQAAL
jgi:hypothetical protein